MKYDYIYTSKDIDKNKEYFLFWLDDWKKNKISYLNELIEIYQEESKEQFIPCIISLRKTIRNLRPDLSNCHCIENLLQKHEDVEGVFNIEMALTSTFETR